MDPLFDDADVHSPHSSPDELDEAIPHVHTALSRAGDLVEVFGDCIRTALDEIIDTARTGRWDLNQCGDQEKAYLGVKIENVIRGRFELPPARRKAPDYEIDGVDVDCKWTKNMWGWSIPTEAVGEICLLLHADDAKSTFCAGLIRISDQLLNPGANKDGKRGISRAGRARIYWICPPGSPLPRNFLLHMPVDDREAILAHRGGDARMLELFRRRQGVIIRRHTIVSLAQQVDPTRRARAVRAKLQAEGLDLLNGHWADQKQRARQLGGPVPEDSTEWVCLPVARPGA